MNNSNPGMVDINGLQLSFLQKKRIGNERMTFFSVKISGKIPWQRTWIICFIINKHLKKGG